MKACVSKASVVALHITEMKADVRLVDGDLVQVDGSWCLQVVTNCQVTLSYLFATEASASAAYRGLSEPGLNHEFECLEVQG